MEKKVSGIENESEDLKQNSVVRNIDAEPSAVKEERLIRHWVIRWMVMFSSLITLLIVVSLLYSYTFQKRDFESAATSSVIENMFTVLKFLFQ